MRTILLTTLVLLPMPVASAVAHPATLGFESLARAAMASVIVPPEWDGVWTVVDSVYHCEGGFITTGAGTDSICEGKDFSLVRGSIALTCAGTADATTLDETYGVRPGRHGLYCQRDGRDPWNPHGRLLFSRLHIQLHVDGNRMRWCHTPMHPGK
mgnify:CR=1 FL=1